MMEPLEVTRLARALAAYSGERLSLIAENVANSDTPGFHARDLPNFGAVFRDDGESLRQTRPGHLSGSANSASAVESFGLASLDGNTVSLEAEMVRAAEVRQDHATALAVYRSTSDIIRTALGRRV
jgi:flagellar basal-body rod protein FlgB